MCVGGGCQGNETTTFEERNKSYIMAEWKWEEETNKKYTRKISNHLNFTFFLQHDHRCTVPTLARMTPPTEGPSCSCRSLGRPGMGCNPGRPPFMIIFIIMEIPLIDAGFLWRVDPFTRLSPNIAGFFAWRSLTCTRHFQQENDITVRTTAGYPITLNRIYVGSKKKRMPSLV